MKTNKKRKKINFMVDISLMEELKSFVPDGNRSDFVNEAISGALGAYKKKMAFDNLDAIAAEEGLIMTTDEIIELKNYGRK